MAIPISIIPLGKPVVPLVYKIMALRSGSISGKLPVCLPNYSNGMKRISVVFDKGDNNNSNSFENIIAEAFVSSITYWMEGSGCFSQSGTAIPPARQIPH